MIIRPLVETDADALLNLAYKAGIGFTSLPADPQRILSKIEASLAAFSGTVDLSGVADSTSLSIYGGVVVGENAPELTAWVATTQPPLSPVSLVFPLLLLSVRFGLASGLTGAVPEGGVWLA